MEQKVLRYKYNLHHIIPSGWLLFMKRRRTSIYFKVSFTDLVFLENLEGYSLCGILNLKRRWHSLASCRSAATDSLKTIDLLKTTSVGTLGCQSEPWNSSLSLLALGGSQRRGSAGVLAEGALAQVPLGGIKAEERGGAVGKVVDAAYGEIRGGESLKSVIVGNIKVQ